MPTTIKDAIACGSLVTDPGTEGRMSISWLGPMDCRVGIDIEGIWFVHHAGTLHLLSSEAACVAFAITITWL